MSVDNKNSKEVINRNLDDLIQNIPGLCTKINQNIVVTGVTGDSRQVRNGYIFVAIKGESQDGHDYILNSVNNGAIAVFGEKKLNLSTVPYYQVQDSRLALAYLSSAFYGHPSEKIYVIGVTGTDGKTTTANFIFEILKAAGLNPGIISTVNAKIDDEIIDTGFHVTTPDAPVLQSYLSKMVDAGITHVVLEVTSHGLAQHRVSAIDFNAAVLTNITHEHLDYHRSFQEYLEAKSLLFSLIPLSQNKRFDHKQGAVINFDDPNYEFIKSHTAALSISYGRDLEADIRAENIIELLDGIEFDVVGLSNHPAYLHLSCNLSGTYNVSNCLAAVALAHEILGIIPGAIQKGIFQVKNLIGRMERVDLGQNFITYIDFAHTPNALQNALVSCRNIISLHGRKSRLITVFGSAGLRDKEKRNLMAQISGRLSDVTILTAEDPRTESLDKIISEMEGGLRRVAKEKTVNYWIIRDRGEAIRKAVEIAENGDIVIICGKGHEQSMCFGTTEYHWDDKIALISALSELLDIQGPAMPYLPTQDDSGDERIRNSIEYSI